MWRWVTVAAGGSLALIGVVAAILFAIDGNTPGLLLVIACLLAGLLLEAVTRR